MENCPNCGNELRPTARFCTSCGFRMPEQSATATTTGGGSDGLPAQSLGWGVPVTEPAPAVDKTSAAAAAAASDPDPNSIPGVVQWKPVETPPAQAEPAASPVEPVPAGEIETIAPPGPIPDVVAENTINDMAENRVNIALFHIERLKQLVPDITGWSEQQASSVDLAISALDMALKGREEAGDPYQSLRETLKIARRDPRDIDLMIALADRAGEIEDLLAAHDQYSAGVREALFAIKPAAVNYVTEVTKRPAKGRARRTATKKAAPEKETDSSATPGKTPEAKTAKPAVAAEGETSVSDPTGPASEQQE